MRKVLAAAMALLLAVLLGACSGNAPDFKSMLDTETDKRYALGDEKEKFDADFGAGNYDDDFDKYII